MLIPLCLLTVQEDVPLLEMLRARHFYQVATAPFDKPIPPFRPDEEFLLEEPNRNHPLRTYRVPGGGIFVMDPKERRIVRGGFTRAWNGTVPRRIRDDQVHFLACKFIRAAGYDTPFETFDLRDREGVLQEGIELRYIPTYRGVTFDRAQAGTVSVNRETGHLEVFVAPQGPWPKPPADLRPAFGMEEARLRGIASLLKGGVAWVKEDPAMPLRLSILADPDRKEKGRLVYTMKAYDPRRVFWVTGRPDRFFSSLVDANSGSARTVHLPILKGDRRRFKSVQIPADAQDWRVGADARGLWRNKVSGQVTRSTEFNFRPVRHGYLLKGSEGWRVEVGADGRFFVREFDERPAYFRAKGRLKDGLLKLPAYR